MLKGLKQALNSSIARVALKIHICLDNLEMACIASRYPKGFSQKIFREVRDLAKG